MFPQSASAFISLFLSLLHHFLYIFFESFLHERDKLLDEDIAVLSLGKMRWNVEKAIQLSGKQIGHYDMRFVKPLDTALLDDIALSYKTIISIEDGVISGGFGESVKSYFAEHHPHVRIKCLGIPDEFIAHGSTEK